FRARLRIGLWLGIGSMEARIALTGSFCLAKGSSKFLFLFFFNSNLNCLVWHPNANHWLRWFGARLRIGSWLGIVSMEARIADLMLKQLAGHMLVAPWPIGTVTVGSRGLKLQAPKLKYFDRLLDQVVSAGRLRSRVPAGHVYISADRYRIC
ncbi:hypothetical protein Tco_0844242, partial [Tanacetum coccineum]